MAIKVLKLIELKDLNKFVKEATANDFEAVDATDGAIFTMQHRDEKYVIGVKNGASTAVSKTATIKAGNALQSVMGDVSVALDQNEIAWIAIDSGRFKNVTGDNKGKVIIKGTDANILVKVIRLP